MQTMLVNFKDHPEALGRKAIGIIKTAHRVSEEYGVEIGVVPSASSLNYAAKMSWQYEMSGYHLPVFSQYIDSRFQAKDVKRLGIKGAVLNHKDHRISAGDVRTRIYDLRSLGLSSVACVVDDYEAKNVAGLFPHYIAIEPHDLIGTGRSVSMLRPDLIKKTLDYVRGVDYRIKVLCGAGISNGEDARRATQIGTDGIFVSSAVVKADDIEAKMTELALGLLEK